MTISNIVLCGNIFTTNENNQRCINSLKLIMCVNPLDNIFGNLNFETYCDIYHKQKHVSCHKISSEHMFHNWNKKKFSSTIFCYTWNIMIWFNLILGTHKRCVYLGGFHFGTIVHHTKLSKQKSLRSFTYYTEE